MVMRCLIGVAVIAHALLSCQQQFRLQNLENVKQPGCVVVVVKLNWCLKVIFERIEMKIFGAGLAGLLAGCHFQQATIYEAQAELKPHKALLRFKSSAVGDAVGIEFRKVRVHKACWPMSMLHVCLANMYSQKVIGTLADRSIWNMNDVDRYIAPEDFIEQLVERCAGRIEWNTEIKWNDIHNNKDVIISTLPMSLLWKWLNSAVSSCPVDFSYKEIITRRFKIARADVFQTIYFPLPETSLYRASITGDILVAEYIDDWDAYDFYPAFGLQKNDCEELETTRKQFGKIRTINNEWRKEFIYDLTTRFNIFSLGRYATWRNILLDDVIKDISVIKKMMKVSAYDRARMSTN